MPSKIFLSIPDNVHICANEIMKTLEDKIINYEILEHVSLFMKYYQDRKYFFNVSTLYSYTKLDSWRDFLEDKFPSIYKSSDFPFGEHNHKYNEFIPEQLKLRNGAVVEMFLEPIKEEYRYAYLLILLLSRKVTLQKYNSNQHVLIYPGYTEIYNHVKGSALCFYDDIINLEVMNDIFLAGTIANIDIIRNTAENRKHLNNISVL